MWINWWITSVETDCGYVKHVIHRFVDKIAHF